MTNKELITILRRFPRDAQIRVNGVCPEIFAALDERGNWTINIGERVEAPSVDEAPLSKSSSEN